MKTFDIRAGKTLEQYIKKFKRLIYHESKTDYNSQHLDNEEPQKHIELSINVKWINLEDKVYFEFSSKKNLIHLFGHYANIDVYLMKENKFQ